MTVVCVPIVVDEVYLNGYKKIHAANNYQLYGYKSRYICVIDELFAKYENEVCFVIPVIIHKTYEKKGINMVLFEVDTERLSTSTFEVHNSKLDKPSDVACIEPGNLYGVILWQLYLEKK